MKERLDGQGIRNYYEMNHEYIDKLLTTRWKNFPTSLEIVYERVRPLSLLQALNIINKRVNDSEKNKRKKARFILFTPFYVISA